MIYPTADGRYCYAWISSGNEIIGNSDERKYVVTQALAAINRIGYQNFNYNNYTCEGLNKKLEHK